MNGDDQNREELPGLVPRPDPTVLTTEALRRDILGLRQLLEQRIGLEVASIDQRFELADKALEKALTSIEKQLAQIQETHQIAVDSLRRETSALAERVGRVEFGPTPPGG